LESQVAQLVVPALEGAQAEFADAGPAASPEISKSAANVATNSLPLAEPPKQSKIPVEGQKVASICFFEHEEVSGMNKICYYKCLSGRTAITISSIKLCPLNIDR